MLQNEIEHLILDLFEDLRIGEIVLDGRILCILENNADILANQLSDALSSLVNKGFILVAPGGFKLDEKGFEYLKRK